MLEVQKFLLDNSRQFYPNVVDELCRQFDIKCTKNPRQLPLLILNYGRDTKNKLHPIVRECRGLVLDSKTYELVARSFPRFFNWGEVPSEQNRFDFNHFTVNEKIDGSLIILYNFCGQWYANTRGSFGFDRVNNTPMTWQDLVLQALGLQNLQELSQYLDPSLTYIYELVSPYNKIVREYANPELHLLTIFNQENELSYQDFIKQVYKILTTKLGSWFHYPWDYRFTSIKQIIKWLEKKSKTDPTFEGVVIRDVNNLRFKIKSPTYLRLHRMRGNGDELYSPRNLVRFILLDEVDELLCYYKEVKPFVEKYQEIINKEYQNLRSVWGSCWQCKDQKKFALTILPKTKFSSLLFNLRKQYGSNQCEAQLKELWQQSEDLILKILFER
jgi:RNA ligase